MNNAVHPKATGGFHWLEYLPGYMYCFLPSYEADRGTIQVYDYLPDFLLDFLYCAEIHGLILDKISKYPDESDDTKSNRKYRTVTQKTKQRSSPALEGRILVTSLLL